jgi:hypothetical protein
LGLGLGSVAGGGSAAGADAAALIRGAAFGVTASGVAGFGGTAFAVGLLAVTGSGVPGGAVPEAVASGDGAALGVTPVAPVRGATVARSPMPRLSIRPPATARPTSISSTTTMRPQGRRATIGIDIDGSSSCVRGRGGLTATLGGVDASGAYTAGGALLIARGGGALGGAMPAGITVYGAGGRGRGVTGCTATCVPCPPDIGCCGNRASSEIFCVGATRCAVAPSRAPQPPQNRESGAFSVPQLGQRIPSEA